MNGKKVLAMTLLLVSALLAACHASQEAQQQKRSPETATATIEEAQRFITMVEKRLARLLTTSERMDWVQLTYLTEDTTILAAKTKQALMSFLLKMAVESIRFNGTELPEKIRRKLKRIREKQDGPAPTDPSAQEELATILSQMQHIYGEAKYCPERLKGKCLLVDDITEIMAKKRNYKELLDVWQGWRQMAKPLHPLYVRFVELANRGAKDVGFNNLADLWTSRYDMSPSQFETEMERLWQEVKPLYQDLHCHVREKLGSVYGKDKVPPTKAIPAHLLGNIWAQDWTNLSSMMAPEKTKASSLEKTFRNKKLDEIGLVKLAESFFTSLGMDPLPDTFWKRSMFVRPRDRDVMCHASAWTVDNLQDLRIKMCIKMNEESFNTIHHELGHIYYYNAYKEQEELFKGGANDGFHEAIGDLISLSVTPGYLEKIGLINRAPKQKLTPLMNMALDKVAFLPWGFLVDRWRWGVFRGEIKPEQMNKSWWDLRLQFQGVAPPVERGEDDFDPGAKYHVPANTPYARYFLGTILQFQFHRALCREAGHQGPLHTCSLYGNKEAGKKLSQMMEMGASKPWPEALNVLTKQEKLDGSALLEYFQPLHDWLKEQNKNRQCGW